jgi:hypothetical protein
MNKKKIALIIIGVVVLVGVGVFAVYVTRNINEEPAVVVQQTNTPVVVVEATADAPARTLKGSFEGVDVIHWGKGAVEVIESTNGPVLSFGDDFESAAGPDLFVYLSPNAAGQDLGEFASLGQLKSNNGAQTYTLPEDYEDYKTVVIWCRAVGITFATAELQS